MQKNADNIWELKLLTREVLDKAVFWYGLSESSSDQMSYCVRSGENIVEVYSHLAKRQCSKIFIPGDQQEVVISKE